MSFMVVRHKVKDYAIWKEVFLRHAGVRAEMGCTGGQVIRSEGDPCEVVVILEWNDAESAKRFVERTDLADSPEEAGVMDTPDCYYLDSTEVVES